MPLLFLWRHTLFGSHMKLVRSFHLARLLWEWARWGFLVDARALHFDFCPKWTVCLHLLCLQKVISWSRFQRSWCFLLDEADWYLFRIRYRALHFCRIPKPKLVLLCEAQWGKILAKRRRQRLQVLSLWFCS